MSRRIIAAMAALGLLAGGGCSLADDGDDGGGATRAAAGYDPTSEPAPPLPDRPVWQERAPIDTPRDDFATAVVGDQIWTFGGMTGARGTRLTSSEVYDTADNTWRYGPEVPQGLASFEGVAVADRVYLFGGLDADAESSDFAAVLDTRSGTWTDLPPLPHPRYAHDVESVGGLLYVLGGESDGEYVEQVDVFDPATQSWSQGTDMPHPRSSIDAVALDGVIYVLGGWEVSQPTARMQAYDPATQTWSRRPALPQPMSRGGAAVSGGRIWVSHHEFSAVFDPDTSTWSPANPMTVPRHGLGYVAVDGQIFGVGGCTESPLRDVSFVDVLDVAA